MKKYALVLISSFIYSLIIAQQTKNFIPLDKLGVTKESLYEEAIRAGAKTDYDISEYIQRRI